MEVDGEGEAGTTKIEVVEVETTTETKAQEISTTEVVTTEGDQEVVILDLVPIHLSVQHPKTEAGHQDLDLQEIPGLLRGRGQDRDHRGTGAGTISGEIIRILLAGLPGHQLGHVIQIMDHVEKDLIKGPHHHLREHLLLLRLRHPHRLPKKILKI